MEKVEELIEKALKELLKIDSEDTHPQSGSKLIFPQYRKEEGKEAKRRVSEQEARFLFAKQLERQTDYSYSVETPTSRKYSGFKEGKPKIDINGRSARIDVCLYAKGEEGYKRKHLIEFKAHNMSQGDIDKDFLKLKYDNKGKPMTNYFVHILDSFDDDTKESLSDKYSAAFGYNGTEAPDEVKIFVCLLPSKPDQIKPGQILLLNGKSKLELEEELSKLLKSHGNK